jgi:hypothetical protein
MTRIRRSLLLVLIAACGAGTLRAAQGDEAPVATSAAAAAAPTDTTQPLNWLKSANYAALESYYSQQQQQYEAGGISDEKLYASFKQLYENSPGNEHFFDGWVEAYPSSYAAVLARGFYLYRMGWAVRGENYIRDTKDSQIHAMQNYLARARPDLTASLNLTKKPYLSALYLLNVAILNGTADERRQWFERGTAIDPNNSLARLRYMFSLRPRWGGSYRQMQDFLAQCEQQKLNPKLLARLNMVIHADLAEEAMAQGDNERILAEWRQVLDLAETAGEEPSTEALIGFTRAAQDLHRPEDAQRGLKLLEGRSPEDAWSQGRLGWIYVQAHQDEKAWTLLTRAAEQHDPWAEFLIGHSTYDGVPTLKKAPDQKAGLVWIRRSAAQCFPDAVRFLAAHGEKESAECKRRVSGNREWWVALLPALGAMFPGLITALATTSRKRKADALLHPGRMQHSPALLAVGMVVLALFLTLVGSLFYEMGSSDPLLDAATGVCLLLGVLILLEYFRSWHDLTADGLEFGRLLGPRGSLMWRDVTRLSYSRGMRWFRIETAAGQVARVSAMLSGVPGFARTALAQVPSYAIDASTREVLEARAQGEMMRVAG